jgi:hypothetical protein
MTQARPFAKDYESRREGHFERKLKIILDPALAGHYILSVGS